MSENAKEVKLEDKIDSKVSWQAFGVILTVILAAIIWMMTGVSGANETSKEATTRVSAVEGDIKAIKENITWIRGALEQKTLTNRSNFPNQTQ